MNNQNPGNSGNQETLFSLRNIMNSVLKRKGLVILFFVVVVGVVTIMSLVTPHVFQATAKLLIEREIDTEKALLLRMNSLVNSKDYNWINSEIAIIKSFPVAERVVANLKLYQRETGDSTTNPDRRLLQELIEAFLENVTVNNAKESNILAISYDTEDPALAVKVVNEIIRVYKDYRAELYRDLDEYEFFQNQMKIADSNLRELERKEADFKTQTEIISPESQRTILITRLADYDRRLTALKTERINKETKLEVIRRQVRSNQAVNIPITESADSPSRVNHISRLKNDILNMEIERERLLQEYTEGYAEVVGLDHQIAMAKKRISQEVQEIIEEEAAAIEAIKAQETTIETLITDTNREISDLAQKEYELSQINRGIEDSREIYSLLLKQREEARISLAKIQENVKIKVLSPAIAAINPVRPNKRVNVALAAIFGLLGGIVLVFVLDLFDRSVKPPKDLAQNGINVLGSVREAK